MVGCDFGVVGLDIGVVGWDFFLGVKRSKALDTGVFFIADKTRFVRSIMEFFLGVAKPNVGSSSSSTFFLTALPYFPYI